MEFIDGLGSCLLVEAVDVLGDYGLEFALSFQLGQGSVGLVRLSLRIDEILLVVVEEGLRVVSEKAVAQHLLRGPAVVIHGLVKPFFGSEVRNVGLGGDSRATEEYYIFAVFYYLFKSFVHVLPPYINSYFTRNLAALTILGMSFVAVLDWKILLLPFFFMSSAAP